MASSPDQDLEDLRREVDRVDGHGRPSGRAAAGRARDRPHQADRRRRAGRRSARAARRSSCAAWSSRPAARFPAATLVRMWRELLAATTRAQAPLDGRRLRAAGPTGAVGPRARPFRLAAPIQRTASWSQALRLVADGQRRSRRAAAAGRGRALVGEPCSTGRHGRCGSWPGCRSARPARSSTAAAPWSWARSSPSRPAPISASLALETPAEVGRARLLDALAAPELAPRVLATLPCPPARRHRCI